MLINKIVLTHANRLLFVSHPGLLGAWHGALRCGGDGEEREDGSDHGEASHLVAADGGFERRGDDSK